MDEKYKCPSCGYEDIKEVWTYVYENATENLDEDKYIKSGTNKTFLSPNYKCKKCEEDIYDYYKELPVTLNNENLDN